MDPASISSSSGRSNRRPLEGGFRGTADTPVTETLNMQETLRPEPRALRSIPESEPLLRDPLSASDVPRKAGRSLHVQFHTQSPQVQATVARSSSSSRSLDEEMSAGDNRPPDGGWGWVVVFASFMVNLIADGITFSFGVFFPHFLEYFGKGKGKTAWIAGIFMAMPLISGPVASFLTDRYGCRNMTILGSLLAALGFGISSLVNNMETLFVTFGLLAGFGLSLCYVAAVVIVAYYFDKKRSLATGISVCGSGIGTFIFAPLSYLLLDEYGWRGATLIMAGFFLNMAICGLLFLDLPWTAKMNQEKARKRKLNRAKKRNRRNCGSVDSSTDSQSSAAGSTKVTSAADIEMGTSSIIPKCSSLVDLPTYMIKGEGVSTEAFELISNKGRAYAMLAQNKFQEGMLPSRSLSDSGRLHGQAPLKAFTSQQDTISPGSLSPVSLPSPARSNDIETLSPKLVPSAPNLVRDPAKEKAALPLWLKIQEAASRKKQQTFIKYQNEYKQSLTYRGAMVNLNRPRPRASSCPNIYRNSTETDETYKEKWYSGLWDIWDVIVDILDLSHLQDPAFLLFAISNFLLYMWYDVPYVYIADNGMALGFSESQSSILISIIGILNMFGEVFLGWVGDWSCVNPGLVYGGCMIACGLVTLTMPLLSTYSSLATAAGAFGALISANYSLTSIILVQQITIEKFTNAYGLLLLIQGLANLVGPPFAGWLYDITNSYDLSFYLAGVFISLSGVLLTILPIKSHLKKRRERLNTVPTQDNIESQLNGAARDGNKSDVETHEV